MDDDLFLSQEEWEAIRSAAAELDLIHGGTFRVRDDAIAFFCSPDNHPTGWNQPFRQGSPDQPREFLGQAEAVGLDLDGRVRVRLSVINWTLVRALQSQPRGPDHDAVTWLQQLQLSGTPADYDWLREQWQSLRNHARGRLIGD